MVPAKVKGLTSRILKQEFKHLAHLPCLWTRLFFAGAGNMSKNKRKGDERLNKKEIEQVISGLLMEIIEQYPPFQWVLTIEAFDHPYKVGKISYDYSGEVKPMTREEFEEIVSNLGEKEWYSSKLEELLSSIHINRWTATYISNYGRHWVNYMDLLLEKFNEWKYNNFQFYDEDGNEINEGLEIELDEILDDFIENSSHEIYAKKISKKWFDGTKRKISTF